MEPVEPRGRHTLESSMTTRLRYVPDEIKLWRDKKGRPIALYEVTIRCIMGMFLLVPRPEHVRIVLGVLGRALAELDFELFGYGFLSNHGSYILGVRDEAHLADIMEFIHSNIARELGRKEYSDWDGRFWGRRGQPIPILSDEDLLDRMRYLISNSTTENLVEHPTKWPGAHCAKALCNSKPDTGLWINRTGLYRSNLRKGRTFVSHFETEYPVQLSRIPVWAGLSANDYRARFVEMCNDLAEEARLEREASGIKGVLGAKAAMRMSPHHRPDRMDRSRAPLVHCRDAETRTWFQKMYRLFCAQYREATLALRAGLEQFGFVGGIPHGCHFRSTLNTG